MNTHRMLGITMIAALMAQLIPAPVLANSVPVMELRTPQSLLATPSAVTQPLGEPKSRTRTPARDAFVQDEVLVQFKARHIDLRTASGMSAVRAFADAHTLDIDTLIASSNTAVFRTRGNASVTGVVARLRWIPEVLHAQPNFTLEFQSNDALYTSLWALENSGQAVNGTTGTSGKDIDAPEAWNRSEGNNVIVAVIDSGVAFNHPDILANMWDGTNCVREDGAPLGGCQHGYDFEDGDTNPLPTSEDHGTHVAGTIAAVRDNTIGTVGVAPRAKVMALKIGLTTAQEIRAIDFARQNGATIINASWGGYGPAVGDLQLKEAIERFGAAGGIFIAAAGNGSSNHNDGDPNSALYPAAFDSNNIISVAATDQQDGLATFSDYGAVSVDVGAPGTNIRSTIPSAVRFFREDFTEVTPSEVGMNFTTGSGNVWTTATAGGSTALVSQGATNGDAGAATITSRAIDLSASTLPTLTFHATCATDPADAVTIELWGGTAWNPVGTLSGIVDDTIGGFLLDYRVTDFRFRMTWADTSLDTPPSLCVFDDFLVSEYLALDDGSSETYGFKQGTSMAAPHVAGVAALLQAFHPNLSVAQVKEIILATGDATTALAGKTVSGRRVNADRALRIFAPRVGLTTDDTLVAGGHSLEGESIKFDFRVRDGIANLPFTLKQFAYSTDGGSTWNAPTNGDASAAIGSFALGERTTVSDFTGDSTYVLLFHANHADLVGLAGVDQDDVRIRFQANDGAVDSPLAVSEPFAVDLLAPTATLTNTPDALTSATTASITVGGADVAAYRFALDDGSFPVTTTPITEPILLTGLTEGVHTLRVLGVDDVGNTQTNATVVTWTVDTTPGTALFTSTPDTRTNATTATFGVSGTDVAQYSFQLDSGAAQGPFAVNAPITLTDLTEGTHTIAVTGIDGLGNAQPEPTTFVWTIDRTPDAPTLSGVPEHPTPLRGATIDVGGADIVAYRFALDADAFGAETPVTTPIVLWSLGDGVHTLRVLGRDSAGNWQAETDAVTATWTVDATAPTVAEIAPVPTPTNDATPTVTIQVESGVPWEILRGEAVVATGTGTGAPDSVTLAELTDGIYTLTLVATDSAGNRSTLTLESFVIDTASPTGVSLAGVPTDPTNQTDATITVVAGADVIAYRAAFDADTFGSDTAITVPLTFTNLAEGPHTLRVIAKDHAGNWMPESIAVTAAWTVDTTAPTATLSGGRSGTTPATTATFSVGGAGVTAYRAALDAASFGTEVPVTTPLTLTDLADGSHTIAVIGRDAAGNWQAIDAATTATWIVDRSLAAPPTATPEGGDLEAAQDITLRAPDATIHYVYGSDPNLNCATGSTFTGSGSVRISETTTITAIACYDGNVPSPIATFTYRLARRSGGGGGGSGGSGAATFVFNPPAPVAPAVTPAIITPPPAAPPERVVIPAPAVPQVLGVRSFADGVLLRVDRRDIYLVSGRTLLRIPNPKLLPLFRSRERFEISAADIEGYTRSVWTAPTVTPNNVTRTIAHGMLLRVNRRSIYLVERQTLRKILTPTTLQKFRNRPFVEVGADVLAAYYLGAPIE